METNFFSLSHTPTKPLVPKEEMPAREKLARASSGRVSSEEELLLDSEEPRSLWPLAQAGAGAASGRAASASRRWRRVAFTGAPASGGGWLRPARARGSAGSGPHSRPP